jgi:hypothetical protein
MDYTFRSAAGHPLTQLRLRLGSASPTLRNPLPQWGRGKGEGVRSCNPRSFVQGGSAAPAGIQLAMTALQGRLFHNLQVGNAAAGLRPSAGAFVRAGRAAVDVHMAPPGLLEYAGCRELAVGVAAAHP